MRAMRVCKEFVMRYYYSRTPTCIERPATAIPKLSQLSPLLQIARMEMDRKYWPLVSSYPLRILEKG